MRLQPRHRFRQFAGGGAVPLRIYMKRIHYICMPNIRYISGRNHENYVKRKYENNGFACIRSSASKGPVDVIAIKKGPYCEKTGGHCPVIHALQCKAKKTAWQRPTGKRYRSGKTRPAWK